MDLFYLALGLALLAGVLLIALLIREPPSKPTRDPALFSDQHLDARRRELARLNHKAAKGFRQDRPGWRFEDPQTHNKNKE